MKEYTYEECISSVSIRQKVELDFKQSLVCALISEFPNITTENIVIVRFSKGSIKVDFMISWANNSNVDAIKETL